MRMRLVWIACVLGCGPTVVVDDPQASTGMAETGDNDEDDDDGPVATTSATTGPGTVGPTTAPPDPTIDDVSSATVLDVGTSFDESSSSSTGPGPFCGDGEVQPGEQCDGLDLQGFDCESLGLGGGELACDPVMCTFDTSGCMA